MNQYNNNNPWKRDASKRARTAAAGGNRKDEPTNTVKVRASSQPVPLRKLSSVYDFQDLQGIGVGAFANVFRGRELISRNPDQWRVVALKRINLCAITEPALLKSTVNEVNLFKSFNHENIVKCFYSFEEISIHSHNKYLVLVLEYIDGGDLDQWIKTKSNQYQALIPEADIWRLFKQIANAVAYIHNKHIMHRDLKPPNVLLTSDGIVKLADFGLSRLQNLGESRAETVCGTPYYMSPERINESPYSAKSDVWSLGCILYEMATLRSPFFGEKENVNSLITKIQNAEYPPIPDDCYTRQLEFVIEACLNPKMEARPTAEEIRVMAERMTEHWGV